MTTTTANNDRRDDNARDEGDRGDDHHHGDYDRGDDRGDDGRCHHDNGDQ